MRVFRPRKGGKLSPAFSEPVEVQQRIGRDTYRLKDQSKLNADRLVLCDKESNRERREDEGCQEQRTQQEEPVECEQSLAHCTAPVVETREAVVPRRSGRLRRKPTWCSDFVMDHPL